MGRWGCITVWRLRSGDMLRGVSCVACGDRERLLMICRRWILWYHLHHQGIVAQGRGEWPFPLIVTCLTPLSQSKSGELFNNFVSGAIGGAVGTMINTPCKCCPRTISVRILTLYCSRRCQVTYSDALYRRMVRFRHNVTPRPYSYLVIGLSPRC
jgi:hypothetical protein